MRIQVSKLQANPFRNIKNYPINEEKVQMLMESMEQTTFWDNILARKSNGEYQIAYGHHRLEAIRRLGITEIDIPVRNLQDSRMLQIMAQENREEYGTTPAVINETVKAARDFLKEHPEERDRYLSEVSISISKKLNDGHYTAAVKEIVSFIGIEPQRAKRALDDIHAIEAGEMDEEAIKDIPTQAHSSAFRKGIREAKKYVGEGKTLSKPAQKKIAREVKKAHEKGEVDGTAQRTTEKVVEAFAEEYKVKNPDKELINQVIDEDRVRKLTKRLNDDADEIRAIKDVKYVPMHLVASLAKSFQNIVAATKEVQGESKK